ncbi:MAG: chitobiase/beta-hexosaminidase C-terminal domain-containing protein, partial [Kiritimatiellaeota bacterium]|nr:chitobiase/beta-hexosaminidase C-terminal domain-containing protein [Kiritimatiellota bacterium]
MYPFAPHQPFPTHSSVNENKHRFVLISETAIYVPQAGEWTFDVASDDGFRLHITGHGVNFMSEYPWGRGVAHTLATFNFPQPGVYDVWMSYYENEGNAGMSFSVAQGFQQAFSPSAFKLVGDPGAGILHAGAIGAAIETDVEDAMKGVNSRLDAEWDFFVDALPGAEDTVVLYARFAHGFSASVNGMEIASTNMPALLEWDSVAVETRDANEIMGWLAFEVPAPCLLQGANTLAATALNDDVNGGTFIIQPRLVWRSAGLRPFYFTEPTPGAPNAEPFNAPTPEVVASVPRGYKTEAFEVALSCADPNAVIRFTLDGSVPTMANGFTYSAPLTIDKTTTLRASAPDAGSVRQNNATYTYLFLEDIIRQSGATPDGWPADNTVNGMRVRYGMNQNVVNGDIARLREGMTNAIPTLSLVTDLANLFSPQSGIYTNPYNDGRAWERPVSIELIDPVDGASKEFHIDAGIRIRGAYSRSTSNPKHSLRLFFRSEYGDSKLRFPLFDNEGADVFDKVDLRAENNYSWAFENSGTHTMVRDVFSRDTQRDMGVAYTRSRYYHLYFNGQYWGIHQTQERGESDYASTYMGGKPADWDTVKTSSSRQLAATDGNMDAYHAFHNLAINQGFTGQYADNYWRVRGLNPDGSRNPAFPVYLDERNLVAYMMSAYYTADGDCPISDWGGMVNNLYALFNRADPDGFKWLRHDAEHSLGANGGYPAS